MARFILFIAIVQSILLLSHFFLYKTLLRFFAVTDPAGIWALRWALGLLSVSLVSTSFLAFRYEGLWVRLLYTTAASWLGVLYMLVLAAAMSWVFYGLTRLIHLSLDRKILIEVLFGIALLASVYGFSNAGAVRVTRTSVALPGLPGPWKGRTAVWVSDTHLGQIRNYGFAQQIAAMIKDLHPDMVFIGGDLFDGVAVDPERAIEPFSRISAPQGIYFVTGNHEEFSDNSKYLRAVRQAGIRVLYNEMILLEGLQLIGVDYRDSRDGKQFEMILKNMRIDPGRPSILLKHVPLHLEIAEEQGISLQLSGHTHRGQVFLFRFITQRVYQGYDYGLKRFGRLLINTSSGAGTWGPPMRLDTEPEIVLIEFE